MHVNPKALASIEQLPWLGNIRELEHTLTRAALRAIQDNSQTIQRAHFDSMKVSDDVRKTSKLYPKQSQNMRTLVEEYQKSLIDHALDKTGGVWSKAAQFLQVDRGNLYRLGKKLGVKSNKETL